MRSISRFFILSALTALCACSSSQVSRKDITRLENSVNDLRGYQAEQTTQISALQTQIQRLNGRLEELDHSISRRGSMMPQNPPYGAPSYQSDSMGEAQSAPELSAPPRPRASTPPAVVPVNLLEDDELLVRKLPTNVGRTFAEALEKIREGSFRESLPLLQQLVQIGERSEWTPNVLFWLGVTYDGLGEDRNALRAYNDLLVQYPRNKRAAMALSRQATVLARSGDKKTAQLLQKKLLNEYPDSPEAAKAKEDLKRSQ